MMDVFEIFNGKCSEMTVMSLFVLRSNDLIPELLLETAVDPSFLCYRVSPFPLGQHKYRQHTYTVTLQLQVLECISVSVYVKFTCWMLPCKKYFYFRSVVPKDVVRCTLLLTHTGWWTAAPGELTVQLVVSLSHSDLPFLTTFALICHTLRISLVSHLFVLWMPKEV